MIKNSRWTIREEKNGAMWWMIRGGAFSNKTNDRYPHRFFETKEDAEMYSNSINRVSDRKSEIIEVIYKYAKSK